MTGQCQPVLRAKIENGNWPPGIPLPLLGGEGANSDEWQNVSNVYGMQRNITSEKFKIGAQK